MHRPTGPLQLPTYRFPLDPWKLIEREHDTADLGVTETLFAVGNGYIGMRANPEEGRDAHTHGTFVNGFHETWPITHAEDAYGFAKTGQTIVNVPDAKLIKLYVDDEPLLLGTADLIAYERVLDFRSGVLSRELLWRTPGGKRVHVRSTRMVSLVHRHLAVLTYEVTLLDDAAPVVISSQLLNRQDGEDEYHVTAAALGEGRDPRQARRFTERVLLPQLARTDGGTTVLGYRCAHSGMTLACATHHLVETRCPLTVEDSASDDLAKTLISVDAQVDERIRLTKLVTYHTSTGVPAEELAERGEHTIRRAAGAGTDHLHSEQRRWLDEFWERSDIELDGDPAGQQAVRWNIFQLAQASARTQESGIAAKGVTAAGYEGHYFWDTEVYVVPFLAYTNPEAARGLVRFRWRMLPPARARAAEMSQVGALYPWRTINGEEASAYFAAGTAQYHINAAIAYAIEQYVNASGDVGFLAGDGAEVLVETARLWEDLGFWSANGEPVFHIHGVTGPDEYTTVVNDNLYTNVMARFNLLYAARVVELIAERDADGYARLARRVRLGDDEVGRWVRAAQAMHLPYDDELGIHPQDGAFLTHERWDFANTPEENYPLLLHYHPLVIYRFQVLKQADVVLAMFLHGECFTLDQKRRNYDYYDPITTGDSSLSACVQAGAAAQIGYDEHAVRYFREALFVDLCNTHGNTADGVHIASAAGVWVAVVYGFAGLADSGTAVSFCPRLPSAWERVAFRLERHGSRLVVELDRGGATVSVLSGEPVPVAHAGTIVALSAGESLRIVAPPLDDPEDADD